MGNCVNCVGDKKGGAMSPSMMDSKQGIARPIPRMEDVKTEADILETNRSSKSEAPKSLGSLSGGGAMGLDLMRTVTQDFDFGGLKNSNNQKLRAIGRQMEEAFKDPISEIKKEYGLIDDNFFDKNEEKLLAGPFSKVTLLMTDKAKNKWVNTEIVGSTSIVLLKDIGEPITVIRVEKECMETGDVGDVIFEYELPLNFSMEAINANLTAVSCLDNGQYFGFYFNISVADCTMFNMKITELSDSLYTDKMMKLAICAVAKKRKDDIDKRGKKIASSIDIDMLVKGNGSEEHQRELYKLLAVSGFDQSDLEKPEIMEMIRGVLEEFIVDDDLDEDDLDFTARQMVFRVTSDKNQGSSRIAQRSIPHKKSANKVPGALQKKVTFSKKPGQKGQSSSPNNGIMKGDSEDLSENESVDESIEPSSVNESNTDMANPSLFDSKNVLFRQSAQSEIKSVVDTKKKQSDKIQRRGTKLKMKERQLKRKMKENEQTKVELESRERRLEVQRKNINPVNYQQKLQMLLQQNSSQVQQQTVEELQRSLEKEQDQFKEEKQYLEDRVKAAEEERDLMKERLRQAELENSRLDKKANSKTIEATRNLLNPLAMSGKSHQPPAAPVQEVKKSPPPPPPSGMRGPPRPPPPSGAGRGPVRPPPPKPVKKTVIPGAHQPQAAAPTQSLAEQLAEAGTKLKKKGTIVVSQKSELPPPPKSLAEQLQDQLALMKVKSEQKEIQQSQLKSQVNPPSALAAAESEVPTGDNKAWDLTRQLKSRMAAMQGAKSKKSIAKERKDRYKKKNDLSDGDTTPSDFDPNDSDLDKNNSDSDDSD